MRSSFLSRYILAGILSILTLGSFSFAKETKPLGINLENYEYPFEVKFHPVGEHKMAYMDVPAEVNYQATLVLLHGKNFCGAYWEQTARQLSQYGYRIIIPDQIGFGKSSKPTDYGYTFANLASNTRALLQTLKVDNAVIVGHSMGGMLAARFALMFPAQTKQLVLVNPIGLEDWAKKGVPYRGVDAWYQRELKKDAASIKEYQKENYYGGQWEPKYDKWVDLLAGMTTSDNYSQLAKVQALTYDMIYKQPVVQDFPKISPPTLLIIGQRDQTALGKDLVDDTLRAQLGNYPELGRAAAEAIPIARLVELPGVGHLPHVEAYDQFQQGLLYFISHPQLDRRLQKRKAKTYSSTLETVAALEGPMPTGIAVSATGRVFTNFPRWGDEVAFTVAEIKEGKAVPYPPQNNTLVSVQSVVVDPANRLWLLDTGRIEFGEPVPGGPKLVGVDLATDTVFKTITFPDDVVLKTTYLNDVRFNLKQGDKGMAYITDSSNNGPNGIIVVDLSNGKSWRRLHNHPSTKADQDFLGIVEGVPLMNRPANGKPTHCKVGADGIAITPDGEHLYFSALNSRRLYRIPTKVLARQDAGEKEVAKSVEDLGNRGFASDGLVMDQKANLYLTNYEDGAINVRNAEGAYSTLIEDDRLLWPDTLAISKDGYLYLTANQLHRQPGFHKGTDLRKPPYHLFRIQLDR